MITTKDGIDGAMGLGYYMKLRSRSASSNTVLLIVGVDLWMIDEYHGTYTVLRV